MIRTLVLLICLLAATHTVVAQSNSAPPTAEEQKMLVEARAMMKASGMPVLTAEQELEFLERSRQVRMGILANMQGLRQGIPGLQLPQAPQQAPESRVASAPPATAETGFAATDGDLASQVRSRLVGGPPTLFEPRRDGFTLNGQPYLDAEGAIVDFAGDPLSGSVTYLVDLGNGQAAVKFHNANSTLPALRVGTLTGNDGKVSFRSVSGEQAGGDWAKPTSRGVVLLRGGSAVDFDLIEGVRTVALPPGFQVAQFQNGDLGTGYVLVEFDDGALDNAQRLLKKGKSLFGMITGNEQSQDYGLMELRTGKVVPLNVSLSRNLVVEGTNCQAKNVLVNDCSGVRSYDAVYERDGRPNYSHYYWTIRWMNTAHGPVAVVGENGAREVNAIRLQEGDRYSVLKRGMGIQFFEVEPLPNGSLKVVGNWSFRKHPVEDIATVFSGEGVSANED